MSAKAPRVVVVTRPTEYELLLARHATRSQAKFFLETRGQSIEAIDARHRAFEKALDEVIHAIPLEWRRNRVTRDALDRFLFEPDDTIIALGQDGLVANVAKYLDGQPVLGINPDPESYDGILVPLPPEATRDLLGPATRRQAATESRTMAQASLDDGQSLVALNEIFIGHQSHQSARYRVGGRGELGAGRAGPGGGGGELERQSSSGIIVTTGTGATGWARSIHRSRKTDVRLPAPTERRLAFFVREAFPSVATGTSLTDGALRDEDTLEVVSEMNYGGVVFGDGIEADHLVFDWGMHLEITTAKKTLELVRA